MKKNSIGVNSTIEKILKKHGVKTVLDLTCGTGSQSFYLTKHGYNITGSDINCKMLNIAKDKAKKENVDLKFIEGDMRSTQAGKFDAVITIFNSIGHLTKQDFNNTIKNIYDNLNDNGLYIFDIFNLSYLLTGDNITQLTIDWQKKFQNKVVREIQYSTINHDGILASYDIYHEQTGTNKPKISNAFQTLQTYNAKQLKEMLQENNFQVLEQCDIEGHQSHDTKTDRLLTIAKKQLKKT